MAVGSSQPSLVGTKDGRIGIKNQMQVPFVLFRGLTSRDFSVFSLDEILTCR